MNPRKLRLRSLLGLPIALASFYVAAQTTSTEPPAGRLLASNCFQCHGYNGKSSIGFEDLAGESSIGNLQGAASKCAARCRPR